MNSNNFFIEEKIINRLIEHTILCIKQWFCPSLAAYETFDSRMLMNIAYFVASGSLTSIHILFSSLSWPRINKRWLTLHPNHGRQRTGSRKAPGGLLLRCNSLKTRRKYNIFSPSQHLSIPILPTSCCWRMKKRKKAWSRTYGFYLPSLFVKAENGFWRPRRPPGCPWWMLCLLGPGTTSRPREVDGQVRVRAHSRDVTTVFQSPPSLYMKRSINHCWTLIIQSKRTKNC